MSVLTLDSDMLAEVCKDAEGFAMDASAEEALCTLLAVQDQINEFVEEVKLKIIENASDIDPDFTSISGDKIKLEYRASGAEFEIEDEKLVEEPFMTKTVRMGVNAKEVRSFLESTGELPIGIKQRERKKTLIIKRKGEQ